MGQGAWSGTAAGTCRAPIVLVFAFLPCCADAASAAGTDVGAGGVSGLGGGGEEALFSVYANAKGMNDQGDPEAMERLAPGYVSDDYEYAQGITEATGVGQGGRVPWR